MMSPKIRFKGTMFLLGTCVVVQVLAGFVPDLAGAMAFSAAWPFPLNLITLVAHQFGHGGWGHLMGNFTFGLPFMLFLESKLGRQRLVEMYLLCGVCAALCQTLLAGYGPMIGSSGAIFGLAVAACMEFGDTKLEHAIALLLAAAMLLPQIAMGPYEALTGVAYFAHVGGALGAMFLSKKLYATERTL